LTLLRDVGGAIPGRRHLRRAFVVPFPAMAAREGMTVIAILLFAAVANGEVIVIAIK